MPYKDPEDQRRAARAHYEANKALYKARASAHRKKNRAILRDQLRAYKDVPCTDCGQRFPYYVMQFDHVDGTKVFDLGACSTRSISLRRIEEEVRKCQVVCANCHAVRTHARGQRFSVRAVDVPGASDTLF